MSETRKVVFATSQLAIPEASSGTTVTPFQDLFIVAHDGDTVFNLAGIPDDSERFYLFFNGQLARPNVDFVLAGSVVTWQNPGGLTLQAPADGRPGPGDVLLAYYYA